MSAARSHHTATLLTDGRLLVTGGVASFVPLRSAEIFDPATRRWTSITDMGVPRQDHAAALLPNGRVLVSGGATMGGTVLATAETLDLATGTWSPAGAMRDPR